MKAILFISCLFLFSCSDDDCEKCTRTWTYKTYLLTGTVKSNQTEYEGNTETFYACGDEMVEAEQKGRTTYSKTPVGSNKWNVVEGLGVCDCSN